MDERVAVDCRVALDEYRCLRRTGRHVAPLQLFFAGHAW
ncbi:Uncharacterised protein [Chlamydia trachomatis]|nr:Uncharacterised protein [Chlamydia trachomatis]